MLSRRMETVKTLLRVRERLEDLRAMELAASLRARDDAGWRRCGIVGPARVPPRA
ncbi:MAG TPA: hypothetical protein PK379_05975 [Candidatus Hydrogenedentes bacterium]|nr:hypothetical protein [Candidatus Hydrogenedentota bacterium]